MKLKDLNKYIVFFILSLLILPLNAEEQIDIWNKEKKDQIENNDVKKKDETNISNAIAVSNKIKIEDES